MVAGAVAAAPPGAAEAPPPAPPSALIFTDVPKDAGHALDLDWALSPDDTAGGTNVSGYVLLRANSPAGPWAVIDSVGAGVQHARDAAAHRDSAYFYRVVAVGPGGRTPAGAVAGPAVARAAWYLTEWAALGAVLLVALIAWGVLSRRARRSEGTAGDGPGTP
jgi:hypothetical protein